MKRKENSRNISESVNQIILNVLVHDWTTICLTLNSCQSYVSDQLFSGDNETYWSENSSLPVAEIVSYYLCLNSLDFGLQDSNNTLKLARTLQECL